MFRCHLLFLAQLAPVAQACASRCGDWLLVGSTIFVVVVVVPVWCSRVVFTVICVHVLVSTSLRMFGFMCHAFVFILLPVSGVHTFVFMFAMFVLIIVRCSFKRWEHVGGQGR